MLAAVAILGLYAFNLFVPGTILATQFPIHLVSAGFAVLTLLSSIVFYFWNPKNHLSLGTFTVYALFTLLTASIIATTGESYSPIIGVWIASNVFAGVFGWRGYLLVIGIIIGYNVAVAVSDSFTSAALIATVASIAPLIASFIIWHPKSSGETKQDKAYNDLASELSNEANKSEIVINAINDGVVLVDTQGVIQLFNPAAQQIIGWGQNDAVGLSYKSVVKLNDKADKPITATNDPVAQVLSSNHEVHSEDFSVTTESGKKILLSLIVSPIGTPSTGAIMVFRDMTKEKSEEREQAEFISTASHEMRTPVASIEGYLGLTLNPATATIDDKARDYIEKAHESAQHLGRLFQDLLDVSKAEDGRLNNNPSVVDVTEFVGNVAEGLQPKAIEKGLRFLYKPKPDNEDENARKFAPVYYVHVDNDHLREVVANLIENAIKYTPAGDIVIDVGGDQTSVTISVQDSGIGIPTEDISHLFQKFYRVDNSDTREIGGTGLGLYLCRRLSEVMGGKIKVESEYKKGSTFSLVLPRTDHAEAMRLMEVAATTEKIAETPIVAQTSDPKALAQPLAQPTPPLSTPLAAPSSVQTVVPVAAPAQPEPAITLATPPQPAPNPPIYTAPRPSVQIPVRGPGETKQP